MTNRTYRNYVKPVFFVIAFMVMILLRCAFLAHRAYKGFYFRKFTEFYGISNRVMSLVFIWVLFCVFLISLFVYNAPFFSFTISPSSIKKLLFFDLIPAFVVVRPLFLCCFGVLCPALFTSFLITVFLGFIAVLVRNIFDSSTSCTLLVHYDLQRKTPPASWVKHETEGRMYFNTLCACLTQTH